MTHGRFVLAAALALSAAHLPAATLVGLTASNQIVTFDSSNPGTIVSTIGITGLTAGQNLIGIDFRPIDQALIALGRNASTGDSQVYTINRATGAATSLGGVFVFTGSAFGMDFNPVPNALRLVSDAEANLRITAGGGGVVNTDGALTRTPGTPDPNLAVSAAAYANNVAGGIGGVTTLYVVDAASGNLYTQGSINASPVSPNTGNLFLTGSLGLGTNLGSRLGFDILGANTAFFSLGGNTSSTLYSVNTSTAAATAIGAIGSQLAIVDIAADPVPEPAAFVLTGLGLLLAGLRRHSAR